MMNEWWIMNDWGIEIKEKIGYRLVGRSVGWSTFLIFSMDSRNRSGVGGRADCGPVLLFRMSCFFSKIGGISSKYLVVFTVFTLRTCSCGWMDGRLFVGDMFCWLFPGSPFSPHRYTYLSHPPRHPAHPTNRPRRQSSMIILSNPHKQRRLESRRSAKSGFSCPVPF